MCKKSGGSPAVMQKEAPAMNDFAAKLRILRTAAELTQAEMARRIDVPLRTYQNYESGKFHPKSTTVYARIAKTFGITVDELIGDADGAESADAALTTRRQVTELLESAEGLFAGAALSEADKDRVMKAISDAYWAAKLKTSGGVDTDK